LTFKITIYRLHIIIESLMDNSESYKLSFYPKTGYLHVVVTGINSKKNVESYLRDVVTECKARDFTWVLIEEHLKGPRLGVMDIYQIVSEASFKFQGILKQMAYVDVNSVNDLMEFAETVAVNRSSQVAVFSTVKEAEEWLEQRIKSA